MSEIIIVEVRAAGAPGQQPFICFPIHHDTTLVVAVLVRGFGSVTVSQRNVFIHVHMAVRKTQY